MSKPYISSWSASQLKTWSYFLKVYDAVKTDSKVLMAATVFKFKREQFTQIVKQEVADCSEILIPICVKLQEKNLRNTRYVPTGM
jgi:hypothetical protein